MNLEKLAHISTIFAGIVAAVTLIIGYNQFSKTQKLQQEALEYQLEVASVDLFMKYNGMMKTHEKRNGNDDFWVQNQALVVAESIFNMQDDDESWRATVKWMITDETVFPNGLNLDCATFSKEFITYISTLQEQPACEMQ